MTDKIRSSGTSDAESEGGTSSYQKTFEGGGRPDGDPISDFWLPGIIPGFKLRQGNQSDDAHTLKGKITHVLTP